MMPIQAWGVPLLLLLTACASPKPPDTLATTPLAPVQAVVPAVSETPALPRHWQGRLSLSIHQTPLQTVFAGFELDGNEQTGELRILGPLGSAAWVMQWQPGKASVSDGQHSRSAPDLQQLMQQLIGVDLPIGLIFDGLDGRTIQATGWWIEPSDGRHDRLYAVRLDPLPRIELLIHLQNPQP